MNQEYSEDSSQQVRPEQHCPPAFPRKGCPVLAEKARGILIEQSTFNWNPFNCQRLTQNAKLKEIDSFSGFKKFPRQPKPWRSWNETYVFNGAKLQDYDYEPLQHKVRYAGTTCQSDAVCPQNDSVFFEIMGALMDQNEGQKYSAIAFDHKKLFVFVFLVQNNFLLWMYESQQPIKHEQWCIANGFLYIY